MSAIKKDSRKFTAATRNRILCEFESNMSCQNIQASCNIIQFISNGIQNSRCKGPFLVRLGYIHEWFER